MHKRDGGSESYAWAGAVGRCANDQCPNPNDQSMNKVECPAARCSRSTLKRSVGVEPRCWCKALLLGLLFGLGVFLLGALGAGAVAGAFAGFGGCAFERLFGGVGLSGEVAEVGFEGTPPAFFDALFDELHALFGIVDDAEDVDVLRVDVPGVELVGEPVDEAAPVG